jgi:3-hydroxybutyryl-CoA dehydrogenase
MEVKKIAVIGAGAMGNGIAQVGLMAGYTVSMHDVEERFVERGVNTIKDSFAKFASKGKISEDQNKDMLSRLMPTTYLKAAVAEADLVIEAVFEDLSLKKKIFADIDAYAPAMTILASNTSSMSITEIASATKRAANVLGMHFFNPAVMLKLVEVIYAKDSSDDVEPVSIQAHAALHLILGDDGGDIQEDGCIAVAELHQVQQHLVLP